MRFLLSVPVAGSLIAAGIVASATAHASDTATETRKLLASDGAAGDNFGFAVATDGPLHLVGAPFDDDPAESGSVVVVDAASGTELRQLVSPGSFFERDDNQFGRSVSLSGTTALVGAPGRDTDGPQSGAAYVFDAANGRLVDQLEPFSSTAGFDATG
ncbi:MAG: FG-GAP repeat protein, partial [Actinomycetota bacterium]